MKNYSRKKSTSGKVAYRTPSRLLSSRVIGQRSAKAGCCHGKKKVC